MEVVTERYVKWQPEEEEEDVVEQLVERKSKPRVAKSFDRKGVDCAVSEASEIEEKLALEPSSFDEAEEIRNVPIHEELLLADVGLSAQNVYFDNASAIWKCRHCTWTYKVASHMDDHIQSYKHSHMLTNVKTLDRDVSSYYKGSGFNNGTAGQSRSTCTSVSEDGSVIQSSELTEDSVTTTIKGGRTIKTTKHKTTTDVETEPVYHTSHPVHANVSNRQHPNLISALDGNGHFHFSNQNGQEYLIRKDSTGELGDLLEDDPEPIDYNVEGVLKKQETHDLICPNCNTCITRRVILKKRKRVFKDGRRVSKLVKPEITVGSAIGSYMDVLQDPKVSSANTVDSAVDGQNDLITCWSCFSLLIPSGNEFKIFKVFGNRKTPKVVFTPNPNLTPLLASDNGVMSVNQGNTVNTEQLGNGNTVEHKTNITNKGGHFKLFSRYGNSLDENANTSHQISTTQTSQVTTSSETTNAQGTTTSNHVEGTTTIKQTNGVENSTQTNSSSSSTNVVSSAGTGYSTTQTYLSVKGQTTEAGSNLQNGSSTVSYSRDEYQVKTNDRPDTGLDSLKDREPLKSEGIVSALQGSTLLNNLVTGLEKGSNSTSIKGKDDVRISIENGVKQDALSGTQNLSRGIAMPETVTQAHGRAPVVSVGEGRDLDILKSVVYGGLIESITSLGVVSSAAGAETTTLNVLALGLANLISGLVLIFHNLKDLKKSAQEGPSNKVDRYYETLGRRNLITLHAVVVVLSFIIFGMIPIVTYAFTFRTSDNRDYKSLAVIGASLLCIIPLSLGKAHIKTSARTIRSYFNSITYYISIAIAASSLSYIAGKLLRELIEKTGWFEATSSVTSIFSDSIIPSHPEWISY